MPDVEAWCAEQGDPWVDVAWTDEEWHMGVRNSMADAQANAFGNGLIADKVVVALQELGHLAP